jgi:hypothetical protein
MTPLLVELLLVGESDGGRALEAEVMTAAGVSGGGLVPAVVAVLGGIEVRVWDYRRRHRRGALGYRGGRGAGGWWWAVRQLELCLGHGWMAGRGGARGEAEEGEGCDGGGGRSAQQRRGGARKKGSAQGWRTRRIGEPKRDATPRWNQSTIPLASGWSLLSPASPSDGSLPQCVIDDGQ